LRQRPQVQTLLLRARRNHPAKTAPSRAPALAAELTRQTAQFEKYACNVFDLPALLASQTDSRRAPEIPTFDVVNSLFHSALLRAPSLNVREGDLKESDFQRLIGNLPANLR
jgi:hypothetical protein